MSIFLQPITKLFLQVVFNRIPHSTAIDIVVLGIHPKLCDYDFFPLLFVWTQVILLFRKMELTEFLRPDDEFFGSFFPIEKWTVPQ